MSEQNRSMHVSACAHLTSSLSLIKSISAVKQGPQTIWSRRTSDPIKEQSTSTLSSFFIMISSSSSGNFINCTLEWFIFNAQFTIILTYLSILMCALVCCLTALVRQKSNVLSVRQSDECIDITLLLSLSFLLRPSACFPCSRWATVVSNIVRLNSIRTFVELLLRTKISCSIIP